ncbi:MAG: NusG domain II-containing protein [Butyrivibrio sp.]|nr:NusG domain II-containing protein [Butyrivibrio sp.]
MKRITKNDLVLIGAFLAGFIAICGMLFVSKKSGMQVVVSVDSVKTASFSLSEDIEYEIKGYDGGTNLLIIKDGEAYLIDSSCPDHLCEHMGKISKVGQSIICLPNRVVVEVIGDEKEEFDTISS